MSEIAYTVQELVDSALTRVREETGPAANSYPIGIDVLNRSLAELSTAADWRFLRKKTTVDTVADTRSITLPVDAWLVRQISTFVEGKYLTLQLYDDNTIAEVFSSDEKGAPQAYITGEYDHTDDFSAPIATIDLYPIPDAIYTLTIVYNHIFRRYLVGDELSVPRVPPYIIPALQELMYAKLLAELKNPRTEIETAVINYERALARAKHTDSSRNKPSQIRLDPQVEVYRRKRYY